MYRRKIDLVGGQGFISIPIYGKYFRLLAGTGDIDVRVIYADGSTTEGNMLTGVGLDLRQENTGLPFIAMEFKSATTQTIDVFATVFQSTDSRLAGDLNLNGTLTTINTIAGSRALSSVTLTAATATQILAIDNQRLKAAITFLGDVYLGIDNTVTNTTGFLWSANNTWVDENSNVLWAYSVAGTTGKILQDKK